MIVCQLLIGTSNDKLKNARLTYSPDPPQVNEEIKLYISGILSKICVCGVYRYVANIVA